MKMKKLWTSICFCLIFVVSGFPETVTLKTAGLDECIAVSSFIKNTESDFFLFSGKTNKIFKFDNKGNFIKSFCRSGEGPGEIRRVFSAFHNPANDYLYLPEYASNLARVSMFDKEGSFKGYMDVALSRKQKNNIQKLIFLKDGSFYAVISERVDWEPKGKIYVTKDRLTVFYFDKTQKTKTKVYETFENQEMSNKPRYGGPSILFRPNILVKINKEGHLVIAKTDDNVLTVYNNAGKKIETITLDIERKKIGAGEFEKAKKKTVEYFTEGSRMQWLAKRMIKLDYKPIYLNVFLTGDKIVISEIARRDENGYPASTKLTYFDKNGKQTASKTVDGYMYYINEQGVFYKYYDSETNETFRFTTGIE